MMFEKSFATYTCLCANVGADLVAIDDEWNVWFGRRALADAGLPS